MKKKNKGAVLRMSFIGQTHAKLIFFFGHSSGVDRYMDAILEMTGQRPSVFFKLCWKYVTPSLLLVGQKWLVVNQSWKANGRAKSLPSLLLPNAASFRNLCHAFVINTCCVHVLKGLDCCTFDLSLSTLACGRAGRSPSLVFVSHHSSLCSHRFLSPSM